MKTQPIENIPLAAGELYRRYQALVRATVWQVLRRHGSPDITCDAEDMESEVWLAVLSDRGGRLSVFDPKRGYSLASWVRMIAYQRCVELLRRKRLKRSTLDGARELSSRSPSPHDIAEQRQRFSRVRRLVSQLSHDDRALLSMASNGESTAAMAKRLGVTPGTVYTRRHRLRQRVHAAVA